MDKIKVIIDTDPGVDDAMAILMLINQNHMRTESPNYDRMIDVVAITTCNGNTNIHDASKNAARTLEVANRLDIPVFVGASTPLLNLPLPAPTFHGLDGLGDVSGAETLNYDIYLNKSENAYHSLVRLVNENKGEIVLLCLGPLTNIATAIRVDPSFGSKLKDCIIMGGSYTGLGNVTPSAEFNFYVDPEAANIVLKQLGRTICLVTLELCSSVNLSWEFYDELVGRDTKTSKFFKAVGTKLKENAMSINESFIWDQVAAAVIINDKIITNSELVCCQVELGGGLTRGQMVIDWRKSRRDKDINVKLVKQIDTEMFKKMLENIFIG